MNWLAQLLGLLALIFIIFSLQQNNKKKMLELQLVANVSYGIQYLLLAAWSATCMSGVSFLRCIIFQDDEKIGGKPSKLLLLLFIIVIISLSILTFDGYYSLIPVGITIIYTYAVWQNNMTIFRIISMIVAVSWIFYNLMVGAYTAILGSVFELASSIIAIKRFDKKKYLK